jgi:hypothetical protein
MDSQPRIFQISLRTLLEIIAALAVILAFVYQRGGTTGRYQLFNGSRPGSVSQMTFMVDSATGKVWVFDETATWQANSPGGLGK